MFKLKLRRSLVSIAVLVSVLMVWLNASLAQATPAIFSAQNPFPVAGGTISGPVIPVTNLSQPESQSHVVSFNANTAILMTSSIKKFLVTGQVTKDGVYTYSYKLNSTKRGNTLVAIELSIDTQAHTQLIAVGNPTAQALMQHNQHERGTSKQASLPSNR